MEEARGGEAPSNESRRWLVLGLATATLLLSSCDRPGSDGGGWIPVSRLQRQLAGALDRVDRARSALPNDTASAAAELDAVARELRRLREYYLPVIEARHQVHEAELAATRAPQSAEAAVDSAESVLLEIARTHGRHLERELRGPLERLGNARVALTAGEREEARRVLRNLGSHLESIFFRGGIVLEGSELDPDVSEEPD